MTKKTAHGRRPWMILLALLASAALLMTTPSASANGDDDDGWDDDWDHKPRCERGDDGMVNTSGGDWRRHCVPCPTDLGAEALSDGSVWVFFDEAPGSDGSRIYRSINGGPFASLVVLPNGTDQYRDTNTTPGVTYTYKVVGLFDGRESHRCDSVSVTAVPVFPTAVGATLAGLLGVAAYVGLGRRR